MACLPATFYRFRSFSTNTLDSLCHDSLFFAHPGTFNDPLDCNPTLECDSSLEELQTLLFFLIRKRVKAEVLASLSQAKIQGDSATEHADKVSLSEAQRELQDIAYNATNPDYSVSHAEAEGVLLTDQIERELRRHYARGVCCFSTTYDNPLLWSHYGDQHRGLCIGYSLNRRPKPQLQPVTYGGNRSVRTSTLVRALIHDDPNAQQELDESILLRKANAWCYESEWRLIGNQGNQASPLLLEEISFGLRCPESVVHAVTAALAGREVPLHFYQIYEEHGTFVLRRKQVDMGELSAYMPRTSLSALEMFGDLVEIHGTQDRRPTTPDTKGNSE